MKFIPVIIFSLMVFSISCVYGQETKAEKEKTVFSAKMYAVSTFENVSANKLTSGRMQISIPKSFSPTISWGKEYGNYNEVELTNFKIKRGGYPISDLFEIGSRYSYNWRLFSKGEDKKFSYFIGAGAGVSYNRNYNISAYSDGPYWYNNSNRNFQLKAVVVPRVNYRIGNRTYLDLSVPYDFFGYSWLKSEYKNLSNGERGSSINNSDIAFPDNFTVNVGIAIKF